MPADPPGDTQHDPFDEHDHQRCEGHQRRHLLGSGFQERHGILTGWRVGAPMAPIDSLNPRRLRSGKWRGSRQGHRRPESDAPRGRDRAIGAAASCCSATPAICDVAEEVPFEAELIPSPACRMPMFGDPEGNAVMLHALQSEEREAG